MSDPLSDERLAEIEAVPFGTTPSSSPAWSHRTVLALVAEVRRLRASCVAADALALVVDRRPRASACAIVIALTAYRKTRIAAGEEPGASLAAERARQP